MFGICDDDTMIYESFCPLAPSTKFSEVIPEHSPNIPPLSDGNPRSASVAVNYIQIFNFTGASMPHQYCNTIPSSISVSFPPSRSPVPPPFFPHWHNSKNNARVPPHQTPNERERDREREGQMKRETELQCGSKCDCASKQN